MRFLRTARAVGLLVPALGACDRVEPAVRPEPSAAPVPATPTPLLSPDRRLAREEPTPPPVATTFGAPITATTTVALADIAKSPKSFKGKTLVTTGTVRAVCQEQGCWMEIADAALGANVRMHGHTFFVPKTSAGKKARVQGTVMLVKDGKECEEMNATGAQLQLDATGIELI